MPAIEASDLARRILETAVGLAEKSSWEAVRLHQVAQTMGIRLDDVRRCFREKDDLIDAWFDQADDAVLKLSDCGKLAQLSPRERLFHLIMAWLDALEAHRQVSRQMILAKLEPGHLHIQIPAVMRVSRTVQWVREGAGLEDAGTRRAVLETAVTGLYLAAFACWMSEDTSGSPHTRRLLDSLLARAEAIMRICPSITASAGEAGAPPARPG
jgi:AcrR family transcriptional regulator